MPNVVEETCDPACKEFQVHAGTLCCEICVVFWFEKGGQWDREGLGLDVFVVLIV